MQFSLRTLMALMAASALSSYLLIYATPTGASVIFTLAVGVLLAAIVLACASQGERRMFWIGFALFGWGYWLVLHSPLFDMQADFTNWRFDSQDPPLLTSRLLSTTYSQVLPLVHKEPVFDGRGRLLNDSRFPTEIEFMQTGHTLWALIFALVGGALGRWAWRRPLSGLGEIG